MLINYLKIAYRNMIKQKAYSFINIFGLALGLTACIIVGMYIWQEINYDNYHQNGDFIYRTSIKTITPNGTFHSAETPALVAPTLEANFPEIDKITRIYFSSEDLISYKQKRFYQDHIIFADPDFFDIFSYKTMQGNPSEFLKRKNTIVISQKIAEKYFGNEYAVGKTLNYNNKLDLEVVGVIEQVPVNSHFTFNMAATYETLKDLPVGNYLHQWGATFGSYTYVMLNPQTDLHSYQEKVDQFLNEEIPLVPGIEIKTVFQPLNSIHLYSHTASEIEPNSSITYLAILGSIALFILILAGINFVNLTTARSVKRAREIGVRKVFGAIKYQLIRQFLWESIMTTFIALILALALVELLRPFFSNLIGTKILYNIFYNPFMFLSIISGTILIGILAGLYPAFVLTHYKPVQVIKGGYLITSGKSGSALLRKVLVVSQFSISIILIVFTIVINRQVHFMKNFDMGFNKDHTIILSTPERLSSKADAVKNELKAVPGVLDVAASLGAPVLDRGFGTNLIPDIEHEDNSFMVNIKMIDYDFLDLYDMKLLAGKKLSELQGVDFRSITVVNETTVKKLGFSNPREAIGHAYTLGLTDGVKRFKPEIIGVVKDFHFSSLHEEIEPLLFMHWSSRFQELSLKVSPSHLQETIKGVRKVWEKVYPDHPFTYTFLDQRIEQLYKAEERSYRVITTFSILAIFIACLGFLGLTFYTTEQRKKEIGIRKVLGASVGNIINNISMDFVKLVLVANIIAWPVSYYAISKWLATFPYKVSIQLSFFILAGLAALTISAITILYVVFKSASSNPIESIRYE